MEGTAGNAIGVAGSVRLEILGPLRGRSDGTELALGRQRPQQVLALLLASPSKAASASRILDQVWSRNPDRKGLDLLKNAVYQVNRKFESAFGVRVVENTGASGYAIAKDVDVDVDEFELIRSRLTSGIADSDATSTLELSTAALALWRDKDALPGFEDITDVADFTHQLAAHRLTIERIRFDAALAVGAEEALLPELREAAAVHSADESIRASLMLALARSGRQTDALRSYDEFRRAQIDSTGIEPSPRLQQLHLDILARRDRVTWNPRHRQQEPPRPQIPQLAPSIHDGFRHLRHRPFAGRAYELGLLAEFTARREHHEKVCVVAGPAGVGKSSLLAAHLQRTDDKTGAVLLGRSTLERSGPLGAFRLETADELIGDTLPALRLPEPLVQSLGSINERDLTRDLERCVRDATTHLEHRYAGDDLLVVLEDAQWVDQGSLALISGLLSSPSMRATAIVTCRIDGASGTASSSDRLGSWLASHRHVRIELGPLEADEIGKLISVSLPVELAHRADAVAALAKRLTGGNPMLLADVLRSIEREAAQPKPFSLANLETAVPESLAISVHRRLMGLDRGDREALKAAAVAGPTFDLNLVARAVERSNDDVAAALEVGRDEGLIIEPAGQLGRYEFAHDLLHQSVLDQVGINHRTRLHRRLAAAIGPENDQADLRLRARHLLGALPLVDGSDAVAATIDAATAAVSSLDVDGALELLGAGLRAARRTELDSLLVCDLLTMLATVQSWSGEPRAARRTIRDAIETARAGGDGQRFATAVLAAGTDYRVVLSSSSFADLLTEASERLRPDSESPLAISVEATMLAESVMPGRHRHTEVNASDLIARAGRTGDAEALLDALYAAHVAARASDPAIASRQRHADEILTRAAELPGFVHHEARGYSCRAYDLVSLGSLDEAMVVAERLRELADEMSMPRYRWRSIVIRSGIERARGNDGHADELASAALVEGQNFDPTDAEAVFAMQMHESLWHNGSLGALVDGLSEAAMQSSVLAVKLLFAQALLADGNSRAASRQWQAHREEAMRMPGEELWLATKALAADLAACEIADNECAEILYEQLLPFGDQWVAVGVPLATWGPVNAYLGALSGVQGRRTDAAEKFTRAENQSRDAGATAWLAMVDRWRDRAGV